MNDLRRLVETSWNLVKDRQDKLSEAVYARMFLDHPRLRDLFPVAIDVRRARMLEAIVSLMLCADGPERLDRHLRSLGRDHRKFRATAEHYRILGDALLGALRALAGAEWTDEYDRAWRESFDRICEQMLAGVAADRKPAWWDATVVAHERRCDDIAVLTLMAGEQVTYRAGQHLSVEVPRCHPGVWRTYSAANAPRADATIELHVRALCAGWVSAALVRRTRVGDPVRLASPAGSMVLNSRSDRDLVFAAGGTGLAPMKAMLDELATVNRTRWVHLFYGVRRQEDFYDLLQLRRAADEHPWLQLVPVCEDPYRWDGEVGTVAEAIERLGPWHERDFYVCGPPGMVRATLRTLSRLKVPRTHIRYDPIPKVSPVQALIPAQDRAARPGTATAAESAR